MARQEIDIGIEGNDGTGDSVRESFRKVNTNFQELYAVFGLGGSISFKNIDDTPDTYLGNQNAISAVNSTETGIGFYKFISDAGDNGTTKTVNTNNNSVTVEFDDVDPATPNESGTLKIIIHDPHINRDPDPNLTAPLNAEGVMAYSNAINTKLRNTGVGDDINTLVSDWTDTHPSAAGITTANVIVSKGYVDDNYVNVTGDTMTGALSVPSGASGTQVPQTQEVITRAGSETNRRMLDTLYLADHPNPIEGLGTPNGKDDLQAVTKLYVDSQGFSSATNLYVSTTGDDSQVRTPAGQEGRAPQYAYASINAAMRRAEQIIESTPYEPGPYIQTITYNNGADNSTIATITGYSAWDATAATASTLALDALYDIQETVKAYLETNFPDLVYDETICFRDIGLMIDSVRLDVLAGSGVNYLSRWAGLRYNANPSAVKARTLQYDATSQSIALVRSQINAVFVAANTATPGTISSTVISAYQTRFTEILEIIDDGEVPGSHTLGTGAGYTFNFTNGNNPAVDQGVAGNPDLIEGKVIVGKTSGAIGKITDYIRNQDTGVSDRVTVDLLEPREFIQGEELEFGNITRNNQITVRVESGIYYEHLPIKLPENVSIKGDEFRRCVVRPKPGVSQSKWASTYFYRDINSDGLISAQSPISTIVNLGAADASRSAGTYTINATDYATSGIGEGATFSVVVDGVGDATVTITNGGDGFQLGETITIPDSNLGGGGAANLTFNVGTTGGGYSFTHPISGKQGKYGYHYVTDAGNPVSVGTDGASNPGNFDDAARLIELNKDFIVEETIEFVDATYPSLVYNETKCRRDTRLIVDGIINDIRIGGREATLTNQGAYYAGAVSGQETETEAAILNLKDVIAHVLANGGTSSYTVLGSEPVVTDVDYTAEAQAQTNIDDLIDCVAFAFDPAYNPPLNNSEMDVLLCNDGTIVRNLTVQRHGGFMMVLDPEGQILTRSPYCQTGSSFSQSKGTQRNFAGGLFIDGYAGNMPASVTSVTNPFRITIASPAGEGLFVRRPPTPFPFFYNGARYQVNTVVNYDQSTGTCELVLAETSNETNGWLSGTGVNIFLQSGGNRSMLSNDFTQINDLGYGCFAVNNALSELVSMFTYYCHTGYIAKDGSQIRSIGGNNSYGFYGLVASGSDPDEIATDVTLAEDMVFPAKTFRADTYLDFASAVPAGVVVGQTLKQGELNKTISGVTQANPAVVTTTTSHTLTDGDVVTIDNVVGMTELNGRSFFVDVITPTTFGLYGDSGLTVGENSSGYTAYTSGGTAIRAANATAEVSFKGENDTRLYLHTTTGNFDTVKSCATATGTAGVPSNVESLDYDAASGDLRVYAYDLSGFPNNVSETEILHATGLYQPYEITNATDTGFYLGGYTVDNVNISPSGGTHGGSNATFIVTKTRTDGYGVVLLTGGTGYAAGETFIIDGADLGGVTSTNDVTITIDTVDSAVITGLSVTSGTAVYDDSTPIVSGKVWRFNLGTGIEGTAENGLQEDTDHDTKMIVRHKQNFLLDNFPPGNLPVRPSTAFVFDNDTEQYTYRTIAFTTTVTDGVTAGANQRVVTFDANFRYVDLTVNQDVITDNETFFAANSTVDPNYTDLLGAVTTSNLISMGATAATNSTDGSRFIVIAPLDETEQTRLLNADMIFAWGGKQYLITGYAEYDYTGGGGSETVAVIQIADQAGTDINYPALSGSAYGGLGSSLVNSAGITLKAGLQATESAKITVNISTTRATGHDMLDIGVGGYNTANYPDRIYGTPFGTSAVTSNDAIDSAGNNSAAQAQERDKGRVFTVMTDQDGFFRVGRFFTVDQGTGSVTFNAALVLTNIDGIGFKRGVRVNEFSNDDTFTDAKGDAVPTQTAVEGYIDHRLGLDRNGNPDSNVIGPGYMSLGGPGFTQTPMNDDMSLGGFRITNVAAPLAGSDAVNKQYVDEKTDELNDIGDVSITGTGAPIQAHLLGFTGTAQQSQNMAVIGDIGLAYTGANQLTASISTGVIVNADVNASAAIAQSKLNMNAATTRANATSITQADLGLASFNSTEFTATNGWLEIATGGIANSKLANSNITVGTTSIALGGTSTSLGGMSGIAFASGSLSGTVNINITGSITHTGNIIGPANSGADNGVSIGSSGNRYNTVWATTFNGEATAALYADLAENYLGDASYEPGTVLVFGGEEEVTVCSSKGDTRVAGVVTTNPAHLMNSHLKGEHVVGVALTGRVPCKVIGKVSKGDMLVTSAVPGYAIVNNSPGVGQVIGKAVGTKDSEDRGVVEVVVGRV